MRLASYWIPELEAAYAAFREDGADVESVKTQLKASLDDTCAEATGSGHSPDDVKHALYATVAWIDELAMSFDWPGAAAWRLAPLQRHYFSTTRAGVGFFDRLRALPEQATGVREVFALMLLAGFQGDFAHRPPGELQKFRRDLLERVARESGMAPAGNDDLLFPGLRTPGRQAALHRAGPSMAALALVIGPLLILLAIYVYLDVQLSHQIAQVIAPLAKGL
jgi:type VI secretion system protein ImpK